MKKSFYSSVVQWGNNLLVRGVNNGVPYQKKVKYTPTLYIKSRNDADTGAVTMSGEKLTPMPFSCIKDAKEFVERYEGVDAMPIYGMTQFNYAYIHDNWPQQIEFDQSQLTIYTIDIETSSENGFPQVDDPTEEVLLITLQNAHTKDRITWGSRPFNVKKAKNLKDKDKIRYIECRNEQELLTKFIMYWRKNTPDIVTGWNIQMFDIPYIVSRCYRVLGERTTMTLSPWDNIRQQDVEKFNYEKMTAFNILGIAQLDYLDLYQKFTYVRQENYRLDTIAEIELGRKKLENPYATYREFYTKDWDLFVEYNMIDVELVDELDDKLRLMELALKMAYDSKCNFADVFSPVRTWDCLVYNHCANLGVQIPQTKRFENAERIKGGFVRPVKVGKYEWVVSIDATSLYPSIMLQYNMSPEKLVPEVSFDVNTDGLVNEEYDLSQLTEFNVAMTANGHCFDRSEQGFFPQIVQRLFTERVEYKKLMLAAEKEYEKTKDPKTKKLISKYDNFQMARKIQLNSLFGAQANKYFRYFDNRLAEGITLTGQYIIQKVSDDVDAYLNKVCKTVGFNYSFYSDTDSCYITLKPLVDKFYSEKDTEEIVTILDKVFKEQVSKILDDSCASIATYTNAFEQSIFFKREVIADHSIFLGKKHYALSVWDKEGTRYKEPKTKVVGLEIVKSSTPRVVRTALRSAMDICLRGTQRQLHTFVEAYEKEFMASTPEEIAFPRTASGLGKYGSATTLYTKGTPSQTKAAIIYNHLITEKEVEDKYPRILEGEKIKFVYLKEPNKIREKIIGFLGQLPPEFGVHTYVDYKVMFEKAMLKPLSSTTNAIGWTTKPVASLESLFDD